jgi:hypothetical protein
MDNGSSCTHLNAITRVKQAKTHVCEECVKTGDRWLYCYVDHAFADY